MSQTPALAGALSAGTSSSKTGDGINNLNLDDFLKLLIKEMQNQDPLNPMDNSQMLQQISQIRQIGATDKLSSTLDAVLLGQNVNSSAALIGKQVQGLTDQGERVSGVVSEVTIAGGVPLLQIGDKQVRLSNVAEILDAPASQ